MSQNDLDKDDGSFCEVGFCDVEPLSAGCNPSSGDSSANSEHSEKEAVNEESSSKTNQAAAELQLSPNFDSSSMPKPDNLTLLRNNQCGDDESESVISEVSSSRCGFSFVNGANDSSRLLTTNASDASSVAASSTISGFESLCQIGSIKNNVSGVTNTRKYSGDNADDTNSVGASSTISGFSLISLGGSTKKECKNCSFLNGKDDTICGACNRTLVANPCLFADHLLAHSLQKKEEQASFRAFVKNEKKRKDMSKQPILVQSQALSNEILSVVESCRFARRSGAA